MRFTQKDIEVVRAGLSFLSFCQRETLIYRFWENQSIEEISEHLEMDWDEVDSIIDEALLNLRTFCLEHPDFSLAKSFVEAA